MSQGSREFGWVAIAAIPLFVGAIAASASAQGAPTPQGARITGGNSAAQITVVGCVMREGSTALAGGAGVDRGSARTMQLLLSDAGAATLRYSLTGTREQDLAQHVGRRVELTGTVEQPRTAAVAPSVSAAIIAGDGETASPAGPAPTRGTPPGGSATGVTPQGSTAHEPGDAVAGTIATDGPNVGGSPTVTGATAGAVASLGSLPRMNVASFRAVDGSCLRVAEQAPARPIAPDTPASPAAQRATESAVALSGTAGRSAQPVTIVGCLVRQTPAGAAQTADSAARTTGDLVLTRASLLNVRPVTVASAVPGSLPSGGGTGTVETRTSATRNTPSDAEDKAFVVSAQGAGVDAQLAGYIGRRVEIVGLVSEPVTAPTSEARGTAGTEPGTQRRVDPPPASAHPSAPTQHVSVTSVRPGAGSCQ